MSRAPESPVHRQASGRISFTGRNFSRNFSEAERKNVFTARKRRGVARRRVCLLRGLRDHLRAAPRRRARNRRSHRRHRRRSQPRRHRHGLLILLIDICCWRIDFCKISHSFSPTRASDRPCSRSERRSLDALPPAARHANRPPTALRDGKGLIGET